MASSTNTPNDSPSSDSDPAEQNSDSDSDSDSDSVNNNAYCKTSSEHAVQTSSSGPSSGNNVMPACSLSDQPEGRSVDAEASKVTPIVWQHMRRVMVGGELKAVCKHCNAKLAAKKGIGTRHLVTHVQNCLRKRNGVRPGAYRKLSVAKRKLDSETVTSNHTCGQVEDRKDLVGMIILHEYPLSIVGKAGFRKFVRNIQPSFHVPHRSTVKYDVMELCKEQMDETRTLLENSVGRVAIAVDMSTADNQKDGYMSVTSHFVDNSWCLQQRLLRFTHVPAPHTVDAINEELLNVLSDWNLDKKLSTITVDGSSVSDRIIESLVDKLDNDQLLLGSSILHMCCGAHILNEIVKNGLDVIAPSLKKVRDSCVFWSNTPKRMEKFEETAGQLCITSTKRLCNNVNARWNSSYTMLETAMVYKDVFSHLKNCDPHYKAAPSEEDWENAKMVTEKLKKLFDVTVLFSGRKHTTVNNYFPTICEIRISLSTWLLDSNPIIANMASRMFEKFDKYWQKIHGIMVVAAVLDPRFKALILEYYYEKLCGTKCMDEVNKDVNLCRELVREYQRNKKEAEKPSSGGEKVVKKSKTRKALDLYLEAQRKKRRSRFENELDYFLEGDVIPWASNFDVLDWWRRYGHEYPILQKIALDIYAIPVSTVAFESAFSMESRSISPQTNMLHPEVLEALACARKNWTHKIGLPE